MLQPVLVAQNVVGCGILTWSTKWYSPMGPSSQRNGSTNHGKTPAGWYLCSCWTFSYSWWAWYCWWYHAVCLLPVSQSGSTPSPDPDRGDIQAILPMGSWCAKKCIVHMYEYACMYVLCSATYVRPLWHSTYCVTKCAGAHTCRFGLARKYTT